MTVTTQESLNSYVTDMLALEGHIDQAIKGQIADLQKEHPGVSEVLVLCRQHIASHIAQLESLHVAVEASAGGKVAESVKRAIGVVAGLGAAAVDAVRSEQVAKDLRDDYAAFSLASIGYLMLHTAAVSLDSGGVAAMAEVGQRNYAEMTAKLRRVIPGAVITVLSADGLPADPTVLRRLLELHEEIARQATVPRPEMSTAGR